MLATFRLLVFVIELVLAGCLLGWLNTASRGERAPLPFLFKLMASGAGIALVAGILELRYVIQPNEVVSTGYLITYNVAVSLIEELAKYFVAVLLILHSRYLHKLSDGILYLIVIGLGFSLVEDALFLISPQTIAGYRLVSFYLHSGTSAIIGYWLGRYHFRTANGWQLMGGVLSAVSLHLAYNLTTYVTDRPLAAYATFCIALYISLQVFILFRKSVVEEFAIEHRTRHRHRTNLLNIGSGTGQNT